MKGTMQALQIIKGMPAGSINQVAQVGDGAMHVSMSNCWPKDNIMTKLTD